MDSREKELIIGYDLCNDYIQMSCYNQKTQDMDTICYIGEKMLDRIPAVLCRLRDGGSWVCGYDAWKAVNENRGFLVENFVDGLESGQEMTVAGEVYSSAELVRILISESLKLLTKYYPHWRIGQLAIAVEKLGKNTIKAMEELGESMAVEESRLLVINHVSAYEHYALNQRKELWQHDVGLFNYSKRGMTYYHLNISKKRTPIAVMATTVGLQEYFDGSEIGEAAPPELDRRFLEVVRKVTANKIISTIYLTGEGFEGDWAKISLKTLCHHRKGFIGSNIFSRGACYYGLMAAGLLEDGGFIALNEDVLSKTLYIRGSRDREIVNEEIVRAGQVWYDVESSVVFIPDKTEHITLHLMDYLSRRERTVQIPLDAFKSEGERPEKTYYLKMDLSFLDASHCRVHIEDMGFGEFYESSGATVDQVIDVYDEALSDKEVQETGKLILIDSAANTVPFHFNLSGIRIYDKIQLCYYIYHHIYTVSEDTFDDELFYWIEKNLHEKSLVKRLKEARKNKRTLKELVRLLLMCVDYYSKEEMLRLLEVIEEIEAQNPVEVRKVEADNYLRYGHPLEALAAYKKVSVMMDDTDEIITNEFRGNVCHNMGIAFARLANMEAALECFKKAYVQNRADASRNAWLMSLKLLGRDSEMYEETGRMLLPPEVMSGIEKRMADAEEVFKNRPVCGMLEQWGEIHSEEQWETLAPEAAGWLKKQKEIYRH